MNLLKTKTLMTCLIVLGISIPTTGKTVTVPISATATVIPAIGVMPANENYQSLSISEIHDSNLLIQVPKNSALLVHLLNAESVTQLQLHINENIPVHKNSVADYFSIDISQIDIQPSLQQIITIIRIDN